MSKHWTFIAAAVIVSGVVVAPVLFGPKPRAPKLPVGSYERAQKQLGEGERSGIHLVCPSDKEPPPTQWTVDEAKAKKRMATLSGQWGFTPLPPGEYVVECLIQNVAGSTKKPVTVTAGAVTKVTLADLGLGRLDIELPGPSGIQLALEDSRLQLELVKNEKVERIQLPNPGMGRRVSRWVPEGRVVVRFQIGTMTLEVPVNVVGGDVRVVPFDARALAESYHLSLVSVTIRDPGGRDATRGTQVTLLNAKDQKLVALASSPSPGTTWLAPAGLLIRGRFVDQEQVRREVPAGTASKVVFDFAPPPKENVPVRVQVDVKIESPKNGTPVAQDEIAVIGRASTSGPAGATRIALVVDVSPSTDDPSGADLNGDGKIDREDSIRQAEVLAGRLLLNELEKLEAKSPSTLFEVTIVRFGASAEVLTPLTRMKDRQGVALLRKALDRIAGEAPIGGTNYEAALAAAVKELTSGRPAGPSVILLMTDGEPNDVPSSLNAAARAGETGVVIHTLGLGKDFQGVISPNRAFPPVPRAGADILDIMGALGKPGGSVTALPKPAEVVLVVPKLPIVDLPEAKLKEVRVHNAMTGKAALKEVELMPNGSFRALVPVSLLPKGEFAANDLVATAIAADGVSKASDQVSVRSTMASVQVRYPGKELPPMLRPAFELVVDSSGSMGQTVVNDLPPSDELAGPRAPKYLVARKLTRKLLDDLPDSIQVGLRLFGHRDLRRTDSELVVPITPLTRQQREKIAKKLESAKPHGMTPLVYSLLEAKKDFPPEKGFKTVILLSDGGENCGGTLADVEAAYRGTDIDIVVHVIGFDVRNPKDQEGLNAIAKLGGGKYFTAKTAKELSQVLAEATSSGFVVSNKEGGEVVARGAVNGPKVGLRPGHYQVRLLGRRGKPVLIQVAEAQEANLTVDDEGRLVAPK
jgi:Mg-chelatase subunit ChlD